MDPKICGEFEDLIIVRADGELGGAELVRLETHLADCPACRAALEEYLAMDRAARATFGVGRDEVPAVSPGAKPILRVIDGGAAPRPRVPARPSTRRWFLPLALAAALLVAVGVPRLVKDAFTTAPAESACIGRATAPAFAFGPRDRMVPGTAAAKLPDGTWIEFFDRGGTLDLPDRLCRVEPRTLVRVGEAEDTLELGAMTVEHIGEPGGYALVTPHGRIETLGTRFRAEVAGGSTAVHLYKGRLRLTGVGGAVELAPGQSALLGGDIGPAITNQGPARAPEAGADAGPAEPVTDPAGRFAAPVPSEAAPPVSPDIPTASPEAAVTPAQAAGAAVVASPSPAPTGEVRLGTDAVDLDSMDEKTRRLLFPAAPAGN